MPELRTRPRRDFGRMDLPAVPRKDASWSLPHRLVRRKRTVLFTLTALLAASSLLYVFNEDGPPWQGAAGTATDRRNARPPAASTGRGSPKRQSPRPVPAVRAGTTRAPERTVLDARRLPAVRRALEELARYLPGIERKPSDRDNFSSRMAVFRRLLDALPQADRNALFPMINADMIEQLYEKSPERACRLLDRLFSRARILLD